MRLYEITGGERRHYTSSQTDATRVRMELAQEAGVKKDSYTIKPIDVPTTKDDLLAWLNARG